MSRCPAPSNPLRQAPHAGPVVNRGQCVRDLGPLNDDEGPTEEDIERFSGVTRTCPQCDTELYDDTDVCWSCGHAWSQQKQIPTWAIIAGVLALICFILVFVL